MIKSTLEDKRSDCLSVMTEMEIGKYLKMIDKVYEKRGSIMGQRPALKTKSAILIRKRMVEDIVKGGIIPPIVVGIKLTPNEYQDIRQDHNKILGLLLTVIKDENSSQSLSLIDGMQRTTALIEAFDQNPDINANKVRVEFWIATSLNTLLYRMLVLNSGQIPWDLKKQLEVLFQSIIKDVNKELPDLKILEREKGEKKSDVGQYEANDLIEMFLAFGSRQEKVDSKEQIARELTRLDFVESTTKTDLVQSFIRALKLFVDFEKVLANDTEGHNDSNRQFSNGRELMESKPMRIGFMAALSLRVFGKLGRDRTVAQQDTEFERIEKQFSELMAGLRKKDSNEIKEFIGIDTLNDCRPKTTSRIGEHDRRFFKESFEEMFKELNDLPSLAQCWRVG